MKKKAQEVFHRPPHNYNCAQAVLHACQESGGASDLSIEDFKQFGGGRAPGGECGALHAACKAAPEKADEIRKQFVAQTGASTCRELKKERKVSCEVAVITAADILEKATGSHS